MGASTWALGSHRWRPYRGALTIKASRSARLAIRPDQEESSVGWKSLSIGRYNVPIWFCKWRMATSKGSELASV